MYSPEITKEIEQIIEDQNLNCSVEEFKDFVDWSYISYYQRLSENFIIEYKDKIDWGNISCSQKLSENFIIKYEKEVYWKLISQFQILSEDFIIEYKDKVNWLNISIYQELSEKFIRKYRDWVYWYWISYSRKLSKYFIEKNKNFINIELQIYHHKEKSLKQKTKEIKSYAKKHNLKFENGYLYAYRDHDSQGRGMWNRAIFYEKGKYYKDWHCDMDKEEMFSFGLGIFPEGNTLVKVAVEDWGIEVNDKKDGKARVWGFTVEV
jgi:hypothetical protein